MSKWHIGPNPDGTLTAGDAIKCLCGRQGVVAEANAVDRRLARDEFCLTCHKLAVKQYRAFRVMNQGVEVYRYVPVTMSLSVSYNGSNMWTQNTFYGNTIYWTAA